MQFFHLHFLKLISSDIFWNDWQTTILNWRETGKQAWWWIVHARIAKKPRPHFLFDKIWFLLKCFILKQILNEILHKFRLSTSAAEVQIILYMWVLPYIFFLKNKGPSGIIIVIKKGFTPLLYSYSTWLFQEKNADTLFYYSKNYASNSNSKTWKEKVQILHVYAVWTKCIVQNNSINKMQVTKVNITDQLKTLMHFQYLFLHFCW